MGANQLSVHFAELKEIQKLFFVHQFCTFRFSVLSLNLKNDENLESGQHKKKQHCHFAELKENQTHCHGSGRLVTEVTELSHSMG